MNLFGKNKQEQNCEIVKYIQRYVCYSKKPWAHKRAFLNLSKKIVDFQNEIGIVIYTDSFTDDMAERFIYYLKCRPENYVSETIRFFRKKIVSILNRAQRDGYKIRFGMHEIEIKKEYVDTVFLKQEELDILNTMKLRKEAAAVRDRFLLGCYTAQRFSDYSSIQIEDIRNNIITIKQIKTGVVVKVPVHPVVQKILDRNGGDFPKLKSPQAFNMCLKRLCKKAEMTESIIIERTRGNRVVKKRYKKYELISSHTARRTGATLMYLAGIPVARIMKLTGHMTEESFFLYIRIDKEENAKKLQEHPFFLEK